MWEEAGYKAPSAPVLRQRNPSHPRNASMDEGAAGGEMQSRAQSDDKQTQDKEIWTEATTFNITASSPWQQHTSTST